MGTPLNSYANERGAEDISSFCHTVRASWREGQRSDTLQSGCRAAGEVSEAGRPMLLEDTRSGSDEAHALSSPAAAETPPMLRDAGESSPEQGPSAPGTTKATSPARGSAIRDETEDSQG